MDMTLEQLCAKYGWETPEAMRFARHCYALGQLSALSLAQPAQAVDVGAIREVIERTRKYYEVTDNCRNDPTMESELSDIHEVLTRALSGEKAGPVDGLAERIADHLCEQEYDIGGRDELLKHVRDAIALPASPTPDKEQA